MATQYATSPSLQSAPQAEIPALGAYSTREGVRFAVWASAPDRVEVVIEEGDDKHILALRHEGNGLHTGVVPGLGAGARYWYRLDEDRCYPDPVSRFQPEGV